MGWGGEARSWGTALQLPQGPFLLFRRRLSCCRRSAGPCVPAGRLGAEDPSTGTVLSPINTWPVVSMSCVPALAPRAPRRCPWSPRMGLGFPSSSVWAEALSGMVHTRAGVEGRPVGSPSWTCIHRPSTCLVPGAAGPALLTSSQRLPGGPVGGPCLAKSSVAKEPEGAGRGAWLGRERELPQLHPACWVPPADRGPAGTPGTHIPSRVHSTRREASRTRCVLK